MKKTSTSTSATAPGIQIRETKHFLHYFEKFKQAYNGSNEKRSQEKRKINSAVDSFLIKISNPYSINQGEKLFPFPRYQDQKVDLLQKKKFVKTDFQMDFEDWINVIDFE